MAARRGSSDAVRVGIYTRISKDDEAEGLGVARQEEDCRLHCAARGWEVARVYEDNDLSAYKRKAVRPEFRQMLEDLKAGLIDGVVAWDIDRFTRRPRELEAWIDEYEDAEHRKRQEKVRRESEGRAVRDYATKYLLSGIARCGRCGAKMRAFPSYRKSKTSSQFRYACPGRNDGGCGGVARAGEPVDRLIRNAVFLSSDRAPANVPVRVPEWGKEDQLASLERDMAEFKQAWQEKRMSAARYIALTEDLEKQTAELHRERALHRAEAATFSAGPVDIRERWERLTIEQQRAAVLKVFRAVIVKPASNGPIFDPADIEPVLR
ncbi:MULTISPECIES: recombinase family protein [unclassified Streptomyces]|uniref:recombinase family protein n=1 Tax=unclassified Streptomyces TaxID=2593676 RepID=UPI003406AC4D